MALVKEIVAKLSKFKGQATTALILGSGWNQVIETMEREKTWDFEKVFKVKAGVTGHKGQLILAKVNDLLVWIMAGRFHTYEGYSSEEVTRPLQALAKLGVKNLVLTSAAGGLNQKFKVGDIVILSDILALFCLSSLQGDLFQDLSQPFDPKLRQLALDFCRQQHIPHQKQGVYAYVRGPHYESFADKKALAKLGADCVGMSTVPETIMANHLGMRVLGLSCITNLALVKHSHQEVIANAQRQSQRMTTLLQSLIGKIDK